MNILKGGCGRFEYYTIIPLKNFGDKINQLNQNSNNLILLKNIE